MKLPMFSVVIPLYNKAGHIQSCLSSITQQAYPAGEIIVVDDGSTDDSVAKVKALEIENLTLICQENRGVSAARNRGINQAKYDYIAFLDADDEWLPMYLEDMMYLIQRFPEAGLYCSRYQCVEGQDEYSDAKIYLDSTDPEGIILDNYFEIVSKGDLPFMVSSCTATKDLIRKIGGFPLNEPMGEDQDFFARAAMAAPIAYCPNIDLLYFKVAENKAMDRYVPSQECKYSRRLALKARLFSRGQSQYQDINRYSAAHLCHLAKVNIFAGQYREALRLLSDPRCDLKPRHKLALWCLAMLEKCVKKLTQIKSKSEV